MIGGIIFAPFENSRREVRREGLYGLPLKQTSGHGFMNIFKDRIELQRMRRGALFSLALNQRMPKCLVGGRLCRFYLQFKGSGFCVSEISRKGCEVKSLERSEQIYPVREEVNLTFPFLRDMETEFLLLKEGASEFMVYYRDPHAGSTVFLGKITERRKKERGHNLKDLLSKAKKQYSDNVRDPSNIFLLG